MSLVLIASTPEASVSLKRILQGHELIIVDKMKDALKELQTKVFDLIVVGLHFDESRMFELMREVKSDLKNGNKPVICYCARETEMTRIMHESLQYTTRFLGAWMYLNEHAYNVYRDPDEELRRVIERCLTAEARKEIQQERTDIQRQRQELHELRVMMQTQEWSPELEEYLKQMRCDLEMLLSSVDTLQSFAGVQRSKVESSRDQKDRVSEYVTTDENGMSQAEAVQLLDESRQLTQETELTGKETIREKEGRIKRITL